MDPVIKSQIDQARQERDTVILQKVNQAHRLAFKQKFPGQLEHCMRLTAERLQQVLVDKPTNLADVDTWATTPQEILALCESLYYLGQLNKLYPSEAE